MTGEDVRKLFSDALPFLMDDGQGHGDMTRETMVDTFAKLADELMVHREANMRTRASLETAIAALETRGQGWRDDELNRSGHRGSDFADLVGDVRDLGLRIEALEKRPT